MEESPFEKLQRIFTALVWAGLGTLCCFTAVSAGFVNRDIYLGRRFGYNHITGVWAVLAGIVLLLAGAYSIWHSIAVLTGRAEEES